MQKKRSKECAISLWPNMEMAAIQRLLDFDLDLKVKD